MSRSVAIDRPTSHGDVRLVYPEEWKGKVTRPDLTAIAERAKGQGYSYVALVVEGKELQDAQYSLLRKGEDTAETETPKTGNITDGSGDAFELPARLRTKIEEIKEEIAGYSGLVVGFSGGVDSSVVAALAYRALGKKTVAVTAVSETLAASELEKAKRVAEEIGIRHRLLEFSELEDARFRANTPDRCFFCQSRRFAHLDELATSLNCEILAAGTNASDPGDHRPGLAAMEDQGVYQPLLDHGIEKPGVRRIARHLGLSVWDEPAQACLSSRIPHGTEVTAEELRRIERAEEVLRGRGLQPLRVRAHDDLARIEVHPQKVIRLLKSKRLSEIARQIREAEFGRVAVDLEGYRSGSLNPKED